MEKPIRAAGAGHKAIPPRATTLRKAPATRKGRYPIRSAQMPMGSPTSKTAMEGTPLTRPIRSRPWPRLWR